MNPLERLVAWMKRLPWPRPAQSRTEEDKAREQQRVRERLQDANARLKLLETNVYVIRKE